jgi:hypothetical protein
MRLLEASSMDVKSPPIDDNSGTESEGRDNSLKTGMEQSMSKGVDCLTSRWLLSRLNICICRVLTWKHSRRVWYDDVRLLS